MLPRSAQTPCAQLILFCFQSVSKIRWWTKKKKKKCSLLNSRCTKQNSINHSLEQALGLHMGSGNTPRTSQHGQHITAQHSQYTLRATTLSAPTHIHQGGQELVARSDTELTASPFRHESVPRFSSEAHRSFSKPNSPHAMHYPASSCSAGGPLDFSIPIHHWQEGWGGPKAVIPRAKHRQSARQSELPQRAAPHRGTTTAQCKGSSTQLPLGAASTGTAMTFQQEKLIMLRRWWHA